MSVENYKLLLSELGQNVGLKELAPDEDHYCCLGFDEKIIVHMQYNVENSLVMLFAQLGSVDADKESNIYPKLLKANLFWQGTAGGTIGVDDESREIILSYQFPLSVLDFPKFQEILENFVNTSELWINTLEAYQKGEPLPDDISSGSQESDKNMPNPDEEGGPSYHGSGPHPGIRA